MATSKFIPFRFHNSGDLVDGISGLVPPPAVPQFSDLLEWMPRDRLISLLDQALDDVKRECTPPDGEPFFLDGQPYADKSAFIESLSYCIKERLYSALDE